MKSDSERELESKSVRTKGYHKLILWQKAREFLKLVYKHSEKFPKSEEYGLKSQLRRATVSVLLNIVEGYRRNSTKEFIRFLNISGASLSEVEACIEIAIDLGYFTQTEYKILEERRVEIEVILFSFEKSLRKKL
ncbi:MAG: four helix bundle protein [Patescibacteria group bacterium]